MSYNFYVICNKSAICKKSTTLKETYANIRFYLDMIFHFLLTLIIYKQNINYSKYK